MNENSSTFCPECGANCPEGITCQDYFHQMLFWEAEYPALGKVHHLMVLCYHLQHPSLYSPEGLQYAWQLLADFVAKGSSPQDVRHHRRAEVDSGKRKWKVKATPTAHGSHPRSIAWQITAADVVAGGVENYCENVEKWARYTHAMQPKP